MPELKLFPSTTCDGEIHATGGNDKISCSKREGAVVVLWLKAADGSDLADPKLTLEGKPTESMELLGDKKSARTSIDLTESTAGMYTAADGQRKSNEVELSIAKDDGSQGGKDDSGSTVIEVEPGEYDPWFTYISLGAVLTLIGAVLWGAWRIFQGIGLPGADATAPKNETLNGTFESRVRIVLLVLGMAIGAVVTLLGAWMAAIETRGRAIVLRKTPARPVDPVTGRVTALTPEVQAATIEAFEKLVGTAFDKARRTRGTAIVLLVGAAIIIMCLYGVATTASSG